MEKKRDTYSIASLLEKLSFAGGGRRLEPLCMVMRVLYQVGRGPIPIQCNFIADLFTHPHCTMSWVCRVCGAVGQTKQKQKKRRQGIQERRECNNKK